MTTAEPSKAEKYGSLLPASHTLYDDVSAMLMEAPETLTPFEAVMCLTLITQRLVMETAGDAKGRLTLFLHLSANYARVSRDYLMMNTQGALSPKDEAAFKRLADAFREFRMEMEHMPGLYEMEELIRSRRIN